MTTKAWNPEERHTCHDRGVLEGEFHKPGCDMERCPTRVSSTFAALSTLSLDHGHTEGETLKETGTEGTARTLAPTADNPRQSLSLAGNPNSGDCAARLAVNPDCVNEKNPLSVNDSGSSSGAEGVRTPDLLNAIQTRSQLRHSPIVCDGIVPSLLF
jgi:hypothetical protein